MADTCIAKQHYCSSCEGLCHFPQSHVDWSTQMWEMISLHFWVHSWVHFGKISGERKNSLHVGTLLNMKNYCVIEILFPLSSKQLIIKMKMRSWNPDRGSKIFTFSLYIWLTLTMLYFRIKIEVTILYWSLALVAALSVLSPTLYPPRLLFCEKKSIVCKLPVTVILPGHDASPS